ncbi:bestrophin family protein [Paraburkholderia caballeronis]|uniref:Putative membrane protein n=1 Tax=Paraburkholderia caballeronis TaxID=416943 RepID=A0A1H7R9Z0_9BURK|nr:bestrophin family ion channel [Paraburkholderia caballeronis]PXW23575.1 putative membrane protein [Paraburkholderia caballeronis]PXW98916.1 putative membrane protein [Paraburkholderia caballeronis]RAJ96122.1 putative membrane protein [Paraburkholderia caballeronis]TDV14515.1 putative membrane protein [Paraburkholderia caballeronis]TDV16041.1 putative membrane protein [Paraburkholderia caballeronis]
MIVRPRLHWFRMLLAWHGSVLPQLLPRLFLVLCLSIVAVASHDHILRITVNLSTVPFSLIGIALAVFLGFRNNASYDRYWEGRKLWGQLLNESRSLVRQAQTLAPNGGVTPRVRELVNVLCALPHALRHQLRGTDPRDDLARHLPPALLDRVMASRFRPATLLLCASEWVQRGVQLEPRDQRIDGWAVVAFERNLNGLSDVIGGCERIVSTPLPFAYTVMIHRTVYFFCALLPFGLVDSIGWLTPVFAVFVAYAFMAHEAIAAQIEDPFGTEDNDLALGVMSTGIEVALHDLIGDPTTVDTTPPGKRTVLL